MISHGGSHPVQARQGQRGMTVLGLIAVLIPVVLVILVGLKVVPAYYEHQRIQELLHSMETSGQTRDASDRDLRNAFQRRSDIDDIHSVSPADLIIDKVDDHKVVRVEYSAKIPLMEHITLMIDFSASSAPPQGH